MTTLSPRRSGRPPGKRAMSRGAAYLLLLFGAVLTFAPFYFMFVFATHQRAEIFAFPPPLWFGDAFGENLRLLLERLPFWRNLWNSFYISVLSTLLTLFFCSLGGFGFAMYRFRGKDTLFALLLATLMIPTFLNIIPFYLILQALGWINEPKALYIPGAAGAFGIFLMRQYIASSIPHELMEAARIDGCSEFRIYWNIVLPLITPAMATLGMITFINSWNNFVGALVVMRESSTYTVPLALRSMQSAANTEWGALMAGTAISVIPLILIFIFASRRLIEGLTSGALKG
ncbi:multiple sugar transport system permease protein [Deinobacterium chartae]|uniref:Multiple sugar transport system permease protein n=1 Tax=Deinobacterium chartae TaxID=521158 RepID=A0A841HWH7_9DEIO|nr:carbohydrate ABC transporter permease [Deinobacterium chartae]MBB6097276.1 multiple sugar transport system permease protein [Deinobacterium chartae]